ncbi:MAG TPA: ABC transporter substrate-binding protein, partial [Alphaproteobacteria bacterium]
MKKLLVLTLLVLMAGTTAPVLAAAPKTDHTPQAKSYIDNLGQQAMDTIEASKSGKITEVQAKDKFRVLLNQSFDIPTIARFTLGRYWRVATPAQQKEFTSMLQDVIINKYADRILNASSGTYEILGASAINERDYAVMMKVKPIDDAPISFAWRVRDTEGKLKVIDLAVEGVSMSITHRSDYASAIERNGGSVQ